jgi:hypothetical protein
MNAEEFYEEFKTALDFLGAGWGNKDAVKVWLDNGRLCLAYGGKEARLSLPITALEKQS